MSLEENKAIVRRFFDALNRKDLTLLDEIVAPDYVDQTRQLRGRENLKQLVTLVFKALPDFHETLEDIIAEGDKVWVRFKVEGTHTGEYRGIAPTGKKITVVGVLIYRIVKGKIVAKESGTYDFLDFYKQLGVIDYKGFPDETT